MRIVHAGIVVAVLVLAPRVVDAQRRRPQIATGTGLASLGVYAAVADRTATACPGPHGETGDASG